MTTMTGGYTRTDALIVLYSILSALGLRRRPRRRHAQRHDSRWPALVAHYVVAWYTWSRDEHGVDTSAVGRGWRVLATCVAGTLSVWFGVL